MKVSLVIQFFHGITQNLEKCIGEENIVCQKNILKNFQKLILWEENLNVQTIPKNTYHLLTEIGEPLLEPQ